MGTPAIDDFEYIKKRKEELFPTKEEKVNPPGNYGYPDPTKTTGTDTAGTTTPEVYPDYCCDAAKAIPGSPEAQHTCISQGVNGAPTPNVITQGVNNGLYDEDWDYGCAGIVVDEDQILEFKEAQHNKLFIMKGQGRIKTNGHLIKNCVFDMSDSAFQYGGRNGIFMDLPAYCSSFLLKDAVIHPLFRG